MLVVCGVRRAGGWASCVTAARGSRRRRGAGAQRRLRAGRVGGGAQPRFHVHALQPSVARHAAQHWEAEVT
eukprot:1812792-Prymnesium_polylepis.2